MTYTEQRVDIQIQRQKIPNVGREDRAMLGSNPSARTDGGTSAGVSRNGRLLPPFQRMSCPKSDKPLFDPYHSPRTRRQVFGITGLPFGNIYRAQSHFVQDQGFREALHPWLTCGRAVGAH
jgi:hypothetical protein